MTLATPKLIGAVVGAGVAAAIAALSAVHQGSSIETTLAAMRAEQLVAIGEVKKDLVEIKSDVRVLKCDRRFTGTDCPGARR